MSLSSQRKWFSFAETEDTRNGGSQTKLPSVQSNIRSGFLLQLAQENSLKFGDEIRLFVRSNYLKKPKPVWMDPEHKGWTAEELKGGYLGVCTKSDQTTRVMVPPLGEHASGKFTESTFRVEDVWSGQESYGHTVTYGDIVVLVDQDGMVWNNKTGGLFMDGYLSPRPRGSPGEVFISFQKNGKRGEPVQYGDVGVYIDVEDSHRFRVGFNNRLTNYKSTFSSVVGGYVNSDGSGEQLTFVIERYRGKIKPRPGAPVTTDPNRDTSMLESTEEQFKPVVARSIHSISVVTAGVRDTMRIAPSYGSVTLLYNVKPESQVEITLDDKSTGVVDGVEFLSENSSQKVVNVENDILHLSWRSQQKSKQHIPASMEHSKKTIVIAAIKLIVAYILIFGGTLLLWSLIDSTSSNEPLFAMITNNRSSVIVSSSRGFKRARFFATFLCWLVDLVTPPTFFTAMGSQEDQQSDNNISDKVICLSITYEQGEKKEDKSEVRIMSHVSSVELQTPEPVAEDVQPWLAAGKDPITGNPLHYAWVRFLNGEQGNREVALKRWYITCEWRHENNIDGMLNRSHKLYFLIKAHYPNFYYGRSKWGNPVYIEQVGKVSTKPIRAGGGKMKDMIFHYIYTAEFMWNILEPTEYGSSVTILDVEGIGFFDFAGEAMEFVKKATALVQEHYPERGFRVFIINAPRWFTSIWAVVSAWVNPITREKVKILDKNYESELLKVIPKENLPLCYGGTNPRPLADSDEERMMRNVACRALLQNNDAAVGPDGKIIPRSELEAMIDPSVDSMMYKSKMSKVAPDGTPLCDENGRPIERKR